MDQRKTDRPAGCGKRDVFPARLRAGDSPAMKLSFFLLRPRRYRKRKRSFGKVGLRITRFVPFLFLRFYCTRWTTATGSRKKELIRTKSSAGGSLLPTDRRSIRRRAPVAALAPAFHFRSPSNGHRAPFYARKPASALIPPEPRTVG